LQKGYCDYYATAMVVLARAAGIPARLAIGY
jgi:transglutaminase-like putative cysteine protease